MIEINTAILCATIPALKPLLSPRRMRNAVCGGGRGCQSELGCDLIEQQTPCREVTGKGRLTLDRDTLTLIQVESESQNTCVSTVNRGEWTMGLTSPPPALLK